MSNVSVSFSFNVTCLTFPRLTAPFGKTTPAEVGEELVEDELAVLEVDYRD